MALAITIKGIDEALSHFNYKNKTVLKHRFISVIREYYENDTVIETIEGIDTDELIKVLWNTGDDHIAIKNRRKNLKSAKSSINNELKKLYEEGKNPEGIIIGPANVFIMSDEARDNALEAFIKQAKEVSGDALLEQIKDVLKIVSETLSNSSYFDDSEGENDPERLKEIRDLIRNLTDKAGLNGTGILGADAGISQIEADEEDEVEELLEEIEEVEAEDVPEEEEIEAGESGEIEGEDDLDVGEPGTGAGGPGFGDLQEQEEGEIEEIEPEEELEGVDDDEVEELLEEIEEVEAEDVPEEEEIEAGESGEIEGEDDLDVVEPGIGAGGPGFGDLQEQEEGEIEEIELEEEVEEDEVEELLEEVGEVETEGETRSIESLLQDIHPDESDGKVDEEERAQLLAEKFNESLAARDRFYNKYFIVPEGNYTIGTGISEKNKNPERVVSLPSFYIGKFPVTNALFEIFIEETGYRTTAEILGYGTVFRGRHFRRKTNEKANVMTFSGKSTLNMKVEKGACWYQPFGPGSMLYGKRNHPVVQVSLEDAMAFAAWTGKRLPTEEEWEAASRTSSGHTFPWGDDWVKGACNIEESLIGDTTPVDKYSDFENDYGITDVLGNVLEWTLTSSEEADEEKSGSTLCVAKGGSFISGNGICLSSRTILQPEYHSNILGFRCVTY